MSMTERYLGDVHKQRRQIRWKDECDLAIFKGSLMGEIGVETKVRGYSNKTSTFLMFPTSHVTSSKICFA